MGGYNMIKTILFDIDGVILSEERCFDASALTVWELMNSSRYLGGATEAFTPKPDESQIRAIRKEVFDDDHALSFIKSLGINSNWDIVYLIFSYQFISALTQLSTNDQDKINEWLTEPFQQKRLSEISSLLPHPLQPNYKAFVKDFEGRVTSKQDLFDHLNTLAKEKLGVATHSFSKQHGLWDLGRRVYQEWYVGDSFIEESIGQKANQEGKVGFLEDEIPLAPPKEFVQLFSTLIENGFQIGFGTGRPDIETYEPLKGLGLLELVDDKRITTSSDVIKAESKQQDVPLGKPHPYTYLQSYFTKTMASSDVINQTLPLKEGSEILIVGDSIADGLAAKAIGAKFAAVLTGLTGEEARSEFITLGADYILSHVRDVLPLLKEMTI